jgi:hypothetical protein
VPHDQHDPPPASTEPLDRRLAALLRRAVLDHALTERRRSHLPILHVGTPGQPHLLFAIAPDEPTDHALRADVVAAMRARQLRAPVAGHEPDRPILVWLTRSGPLELADIDAAWFAAARHAFAEAGAPLTFVVVNRHGWRDPATGGGRQWRRLRAS